MTKQIRKATLVSALVVIGVLAAMPAAAQNAGQPGFGRAPGIGAGRNGSACCLDAPAGTLTADETTWLTYMREEEKLARDVYQQFDNRWKLRIFANIVRSEARHFEAVGSLIEAYGVKDPAAGMQPGVFSDPKLAALYERLIAQGMLSVKDALQAGLEIEKADIADLESALKATQKTDLKTVFSNLLAGSLNHQEAFENTLEVVQ